MSNVTFSYLSAFEAVMSHLQKGKESIYFLFDMDEAIKLKKLVELCYIGDHQVGVSYWDNSFKTVAFKVYPTTTMDRSKPKIKLLPSHADQLQDLFKRVIRFTDEEISFMKSRNYLN